MMRRIMIAAPCSGSGKTSITIALLKSLKERGVNVFSVKAGPDYIDPLFHRVVSGVDAYNLDTYFTNGETTRALLKQDFEGHDFAVMEGVMGLYDGVGGILEEGSSYLLAKETKTPIFLVINAKGAGKSLAAQIAGMKLFDKEGLIRGVILNRVSEKYYGIIKSCIEEETNLPVLGFLPDKKEFALGSRHLGLVTPDEIETIREITKALSEEFIMHVDLDAVIRISESTEGVEDNTNAERNSYYKMDSDNTGNTEGCGNSDKENAEITKRTDNSKCVIAVSKDEAFQFLYEENLRLLKKLGAEIRFFSPLHDEQVPEYADALILCGGYPELYLDRLCSNISMRESIRKCFKKNMPFIAECGGFIYLHKKIEDLNGKIYDGAGIIDAFCKYTGKSVRFGYLEIREKNANFMPENGKIKGHEFHYYESDQNGNDCISEKPFDHAQYECIHKTGNSWLGFPHLYYPSNPDFVKSFIRLAEEYSKRRW